MNKLTLAEQIAVMQAHLEGKEIEFRDMEFENDEWEPCPNPSWDWSGWNYRVKPAEGLTIPWYLIKPEYKWGAADQDGKIYVFKVYPTLQNCNWSTNAEHFARVDHFGLVERGDIAWDESLIQRPE